MFYFVKIYEANYAKKMREVIKKLTPDAKPKIIGGEAMEKTEQDPKGEYLSSDLWYRAVMQENRGFVGKKLKNEIYEALLREVPSLCSMLLERTCNLACTHCIYQTEKSSKKASDQAGLTDLAVAAVREMPTKAQSVNDEGPKFIHEGRILTKWHLDVFEAIKKARPDVKIGLIDNGTYVKYIDEFKHRGLQLDWLDVSVDGTETNHNRQRDPIHKTSFREAIKGLERAREVVKSSKDGGRVSSLLTLTKINYHDIEAVAEMLLTGSPGYENGLVDKFSVTTLSPAREPNKLIELSPNFASGDIQDFDVAWQQIRNIFARYNKDSEQVRFTVYRIQDIEKITRTVGPKKFLEAVSNESGKDGVRVTVGEMIFTVDGVTVNYHPLSTWPNETLLIDGDGVNRVAYSAQYTLKELQTGRSKSGEDVFKYSVNQLDSDFSFPEQYRKQATQWWKCFGETNLDKEADFFRRLREMAVTK